jgi:hypothetical protein
VLVFLTPSLLEQAVLVEHLPLEQIHLLTASLQLLVEKV